MLPAHRRTFILPSTLRQERLILCRFSPTGHVEMRPRWTWLALDRQRKRVTAFVNGKRTDHNCANLLKKLVGARVQRFHTDKWVSYLKLLPEKNHLVGKEGTRNIERHNLNFRTQVKRLQRRTISFSKSAEMHDAVIKLYVQHSNHAPHHV